METTFQEFLDQNIQYLPLPHENMVDVYRKQHEAFIAYVDERVEAKMNEIDDILRKRHIDM